MKRTILIALGLTMLPLVSVAQADTATLLAWQKADAPVALVEEIIDPALCCTTAAGKPQLSVRILAADKTIVKDGTILILEAEGIAPSTQGAARRWILNLEGLEGLRSLHTRSEVLHAHAPAGILADPRDIKGLNVFQKTSWLSIDRYLSQEISAEEIQRTPIICREQFHSSAKRFTKNGKRYEAFSLVCDVALAAPWSKGYQPGERIMIHWPEVEVGNSPRTAAEHQEYSRRIQEYNGRFILTDRFERSGNTLHLFMENCRCISGHKGNTDQFADILSRESTQQVQLKFDESSPYLPNGTPHPEAQSIDFTCHRLYREICRDDTVVRCRKLRYQIGDYDGPPSALYKWSYNTVEVEECLKGRLNKGVRLTYSRQLEGCKTPNGVYEDEGCVYIGFNRHEGKWNPVEQTVNLGLHDWQFLLANADTHEEAMQRVLAEHPEIFGRKKPAAQTPDLDTEQARQIALHAIREQQGNVDIPYNVQGYGNFLLVYPAASHRGQGPAVIVNRDGSVARIFHFDPDSNI